MASFQKYLTKDGTKWMYKYYTTLDPATGKRKQSTKRGFSTKKEAQLDAARAEQEIASGTFLSPNKTLTFEQVYNQWFETISGTFKPSTRKAVKSKFKRQILPHFGNLKMKDITKTYCQEAINKIAREIKSVRDARMYANRVFEYAIRMDIIAANPLNGTVIPKAEHTFMADHQDEPRNYWEKTEIKKFLHTAKTECSARDYLMFHLMIYTGGRKGEILALRWSDINFKSKLIHFNKTLFYEKDVYMSLTSKTAASRRSISLDDTTLGLLRKYHTGQKEKQLALSSKMSDMIFTRAEDVPLRLGYPNDKLASLITKCGLHPITIHGLRHTHASLLFEAGASIKEVQERLGHSDIQMTMNIYTHVTSTVKEKTADRFEKFLKM